MGDKGKLVENLLVNATVTAEEKKANDQRKKQKMQIEEKTVLFLNDCIK